MQRFENAMFGLTLALCGVFSLLAWPTIPLA
jgi:hypothetical protein